MALGSNDVQPACFTHTRAKFDIGSTACHVGGNGNNTGKSGVQYNLRFALMLFRIQHIMGDVFPLEHPANRLGDIHTRRTHEHGPFDRTHFLDLVKHGIEALTLRLVNHVVLVFAYHRLVRRDDNNIKLVNIKKLRRLCFRGTGHARKFLIEPEIVLQRNRCERLHVPLNFYAFLCFNGLMEPVGIPSAGQQTSGELIYNHHLAVIRNDVLFVFLVQRICA